jgi:hypothetical protein
MSENSYFKSHKPGNDFLVNVGVLATLVLFLGAAILGDMLVNGRKIVPGPSGVPVSNVFNTRAELGREQNFAGIVPPPANSILETGDNETTLNDTNTVYMTFPAAFTLNGLTLAELQVNGCDFGWSNITSVAGHPMTGGQISGAAYVSTDTQNQLAFTAVADETGSYGSGLDAQFISHGIYTQPIRLSGSYNTIVVKFAGQPNSTLNADHRFSFDGVVCELESIANGDVFLYGI